MWDYGRRPHMEAEMREIVGVRIPDSKIAVGAMEMAEASSHPSLYKHVLRTFVFGSIVGKAECTRYDEELFFLGSVLHDLGLTDRFGGPAGRFEVVRQVRPWLRRTGRQRPESH
jgi:hypothetical protein